MEATSAPVPRRRGEGRSGSGEIRGDPGPEGSITG